MLAGEADETGYQPLLAVLSRLYNGSGKSALVEVHMELSSLEFGDATALHPMIAPAGGRQSARGAAQPGSQALIRIPGWDEFPGLTVVTADGGARGGQGSGAIHHATPRGVAEAPAARPGGGGRVASETSRREGSRGAEPTPQARLRILSNQGKRQPSGNVLRRARASVTRPETPFLGRPGSPTGLGGPFSNVAEDQSSGGAVTGAAVPQRWPAAVDRCTHTVAPGGRHFRDGDSDTSGRMHVSRRASPT
jgi:hypothetical protein